MHEIITLQFGQQANYVGTHYWNTQESYFTYTGQDESPVDHDISFRPGIGADGSDTYTPRALLYDLKGAFGTLRRENALYQLQQQDDSPLDGGWGANTVPLRLPQIAPSSYQQALDQGVEPPPLTIDNVRFWSDYNHIFYHPRSIVQLNEYELNSSLMPFERRQTGEELFLALDREDDLLDRDLRRLLEECDQLQGIQVFTSIDDAWGGFASQYMERVADELGKGCRWVFGLTDGKRTTRDRRMLQIANSAHSFYAFNSSASIHIPLSYLPASLPAYVTLEASSTWHTSALQAVFAESLTLPTRLRSTESAYATFDQVETVLDRSDKRRIAAPSLSTDDPVHLEDEIRSKESHDGRLTNGLTEEGYGSDDPTPDMDMFPNFASNTASGGRRLGRRVHKFSTFESLRGPWKSASEIETSSANNHDRRSDRPNVSIHQSQLLFPLLPSFPHIFRLNSRPQNLAINSSLSTSTAVAQQIRELEASARRLIGIDEREALCDSLAVMAEEYEEGWSESDDDGDDG